jgi:hypothetical protein
MKVEDQKIESLLYQIYESNYYVMPFADDFQSNEEYKLYANHVEIMIEEFDLIRHFTSKKSTLYVTKFGRNVIVNYGGWMKYLNHVTKVQERVELKAQYDLLVSKYLAKTRFWPLVISIISLLLTIGNILKIDK